MTLINWLADFSRTNCVGICAFLVPAMLVCTSIYLGLTYYRQPRWLVNGAWGLTLTCCLGMVLHVASWFTIGVVTPVTFILLGLALTCGGLTTTVQLLWRRWSNNFRPLSLV